MSVTIGLPIVKIHMYAQKPLPSTGAEKLNYGVVAISDSSPDKTVDRREIVLKVS